MTQFWNTLQSHFLPDTEIYADLPGLRASDSPPTTLPLRILVTSARPDIVNIDSDIITLLELTIPINTKEGLQNARDRKLAKENYITLIGDLHTRGFKAELETVEVGSLGHFSSDTIQSVHSLLNHLKRRSICTLLLSLSKLAISCSQVIFNCHKQSEWSPPSFFWLYICLPVSLLLFILSFVLKLCPS